ncbi:restriction endonuclease subunit S [Aerococcaceae bacterium NML191219]|nr:restriction endonuclease subunit S [Aerococcaceae bacterium NML191219]
MVNYPKDWEIKILGDELNYIQPAMYIAKSIVDVGSTPVITAGKSYVLGYSNEKNTFKEFPVILFDDFTTEVRFVDFEFLVRSSATKFLTLSGDSDLRFLFMLLDSIHYNIEAHERHWIKKFSKFKVTIPKISEQKSIVSALNSFDTHINNLSRLIEKKKMIRDGALEELVSGTRRLEGFSGDWEEKAISKITKDVITGGTPSTSIIEYWGGDIPWLASTEIHQKIIRKPTKMITELGLAYSSAKIIPKDSVVIALAGQGKTRGTTAILSSSMAINQSLAGLVCNEETNSKFIYYVMNNNYNKLRELSSGDGGRGGLNKKLLKEFIVYIPTDIKEQEAIADILSAMDKEIENLEREKEKYIQLKAGAMDDLLTGKIRLV